MYLDKTTFSTVIESTPLVSIDLVVLDQNGQALLGQRLNRPAKDYWFVPGGRIQKNETLESAFQRLTQEELGTAFTIDQARLLGPFTHLYEDHVFGEEFGTHYVAIAYILKVNREELNLPLQQQHGAYQWFDVQHLLSSSEVHLHTKWYFETKSSD
ncbi:GDP-mannose mannosyl hydrolase [Vibrio sp. WJH972]